MRAGGPFPRDVRSVRHEFVKRSIQSLLRRFGLELRRASVGEPAPAAAPLGGWEGWSVANLHKPGLAPRVVFDVGVGEGTPDLYRAFPDAHFVLVEPLEEFEAGIREILADLRGELVLAAAADRVGTGEIHVEPNLAGRSSMVRRTALTATGDAVSTRPVPMTTLDAIVRERGLAGPFGIKIDTEGYELVALRGAAETLGHTQFVIAEVSVSPRFEHGYRAHELVGALADAGFVLADVLRVVRSRTSGNALFVDAMFRPAADLSEAGSDPGGG